MVKKFKQFEPARVSWRNRGAYLALWAGNEPYKSSFLSDDEDGGRFMDWPRILAYVTGTVDQELLHRNEYLVAENRILSDQANARLLLSDSEKKTLAEIGYPLGRKALEDVANAAEADTILGLEGKLVTQKFDGSNARRKVGRPQGR